MTRRVYVIESIVFLLVLIPSMGFLTLGGPADRLGFPVVAVAIVLHNITLTALALYLVWRNGDGLPAVGWRRRGILREALIGAALFVPLFFGIAIVQSLLHFAGLPEPTPPPSFLLPRSGADYALALALLVVVAVSEETVFRGYLFLRFTQATGSRLAAVLASSALFAVGHAYEGLLGVVAVGVIGLAFALVYLWRGSLVAPMTMHFIQNFIGLLIAPKFLTG
ncbi:MAG: CPBP family intramembrane glutamic endopeptidase [Sulfurifustis sp.]